MEQTANTLWSRHDCVSADVEGSLVLLDLEKLVYHSLNATASAVWQALETPSTVSSVTARLTSRFQIDSEHCHQSVTRLLHELEALNLVHASSPSSDDSLSTPPIQLVAR